MREVLDLGDIQFYWRTTPDRNMPPNLVPVFLPFQLSFDRELQLFKQVENKRVFECLERVYREGDNVGYLQEGHALATGYAGDFLRFLHKYAAPLIGRRRAKVTEIGCGSGYILNEMKKVGYQVLGIEPGKLVRQSWTGDFSIIKGFYPSARAPYKNDYIIHYDVLEHIVDPVSFLAEHFHDLYKTGRILFAVPDCSSYLAMGDISALIHEHINYFDEESLRLTVEKAGYHVVSIEKSNHGGVLFCAAEIDNRCKNSQTVLSVDRTEKFETFLTRHNVIMERLVQLITEYRKANQSFGFYVPLRALPYLSIMKIFEGFRLFDDDPGLHGKYFDGFGPFIENAEDLASYPVHNIIIMSVAFADAIAQAIRKKTGRSVNIVTLKDLAADNCCQS